MEEWLQKPNPLGREGLRNRRSRGWSPRGGGGEVAGWAEAAGQGPVEATRHAGSAAEPVVAGKAGAWGWAEAAGDGGSTPQRGWGWVLSV